MPAAPAVPAAAAAAAATPSSPARRRAPVIRQHVLVGPRYHRVLMVGRKSLLRRGLHHRVVLHAVHSLKQAGCSAAALLQTLSSRAMPPACSQAPLSCSEL